jgi:aspartate kinase
MHNHRNKTVMKFGGTSVKDSISIDNVIGIVKKEKASKIVVVSAISNGTNSLEAISHLAANKKVNEAKTILHDLISRHFTIINKMVSAEFKHEAIGKIESYEAQIEELITGLAILNELTLRILDSFRVFGELMSSTVIYYSMVSAGLDVTLIDSRNIIKTDNDFSRAYPDFELTQKNIDGVILPLLKKGKTVLAQGFIASTVDGISTTMGRESSDFSAAIYGAAIGADEIQIWTDVDGILTADPNMIKNTLKLSQISFQEMEELSNFGAKVLHKNSIKPVLKKDIPLRILNSKNVLSKGTVVNSKLIFTKLIKSITFKKNIIVLRLKPKESLNLYVFWEMMLNILNKHKPQIDILVSSNNALIIVIAENNYTKIHYEDLKNEFDEISDYKLIKNKVLITLVGSDLSSIDKFEERIFKCNVKIKNEAVVFGYNQHSFSLLIDARHGEGAIKNLHREFFENHIQKTGKEIESALDKSKFELVGKYDIDNPVQKNLKITPNVAIEFSTPSGIIENIKFLASKKINIVCGTTGWYDKIDVVKDIVKESGTGFIYASNFSLGVNIFFQIIKNAAKLIDKYSTYDIAVHEMHHNQKLDRPSGTALKIADLLLENLSHKKEIHSANEKPTLESIDISSSRVGNIFGTHKVIFDSSSDTITVEHNAKSRRGFAEGALIAASFILNKKGFFKFEEIFTNLT